MTNSSKDLIIKQLNDLSSYNVNNNVYATTELLSDLTDVGPINWLNLLGLTTISGIEYKSLLKNALKKPFINKPKYEYYYNQLLALNRHYDENYRYLINGHDYQLYNLASKELINDRLTEITYALNHFDDLNKSTNAILKGYVAIRRHSNHVPFDVFTGITNLSLIGITTVKHVYNHKLDTLLNDTLFDENEYYISLPVTKYDELKLLQKLAHKSKNLYADKLTGLPIKRTDKTIIDRIIRMKNLITELN